MKDFNNLFEIASGVSFSDYINSLCLNESTVHAALSGNQIDTLMNKLDNLPEKYIHMLFLYYNKIKINNIERLLNINSVDHYVHYLNQLLSTSIGLQNTLISHDSMKIACNKLLENNTLGLLNNIVIENITYSNRFKRKINKVIPHCITMNSHPLFKKIAVILIIMIVGTTSIFTFNVTARQKLFNWLINTFPKYSEFLINTPDTGASNDLDKYNITYLPDGFNIREKYKSSLLVSEDYKNSNNKYIRFFKKSADNSPIIINTENTKIEVLVYNGTEYIYWEKDDVHYITWEYNGLAFNINTNLDKEICIKIAQSVKNQ